MTALDLSVVNAKPRDRHVQEACVALSDLFTLGDLQLRSAWLYYGSVATASKVFGITVSAYTSRCRIGKTRAKWLSDYSYNTAELRGQLPLQMCRGQENGWWLDNYYTLEKVSEQERVVIVEGAHMILNLPDTERGELFSSDVPMLTCESYIAKVQEWIERAPDSPPAAMAVELLENYVEMAHWLSDMRQFFECAGLHRPLLKILQHKDELRKAAVGSNICAIACSILNDYERYVSQWAALEVFARKQRAIIKSKYQSFRAAVGERDGYQCARCGVEGGLHLDHITPVTRGGPSVVENLQFLCADCNNKKRRQVVDYRKIAISKGVKHAGGCA